MKWLKRIGVLVLLYAAGPLGMAAFGDVDLEGDWRTANRESTIMIRRMILFRSSADIEH